MQLLEYVQLKLNELADDENAKVSSEDLEPFLDKHRMLDYNQLQKYIPSGSGISINRTSCMVSVPLRDLYYATEAQFQHYAGPGGLHLHPLERHFMIDGTRYDEDSGGELTFNPISFTLDFDTQFSTGKTVKAVGHIVNIDGPYGLMYEVIGLLAGWMYKLASTRGQEFDKLAARYERWRQLHYGAGVVYGGWRV